MGEALGLIAANKQDCEDCRFFIVDIPERICMLQKGDNAFVTIHKSSMDGGAPQRCPRRKAAEVLARATEALK